MVQTVIAPDDMSGNFEQQWRDISPDQLMDTKLKCVFELPAEQVENQPSEETAKTSPKVPFVQSAPLNTNSADSELQKAAAEVSFILEKNQYVTIDQFVTFNMPYTYAIP